MASPFSGRAGRLASIAQGMQLDGVLKDINKTVKQGRDASLSSLKSGYTSANRDYDTAIDLYDPFVSAGRKAFDQYTDATGVNGQEGHDRAVSNFRAGPGYSWMVDQATDAVARKASALGALGSGNTMAAITDRASGLADQEFDDYLDRLNGVAQVGYDATGRQAGLHQGKGDLDAQYGRDRAEVHGGATSMGVGAKQNIGLAQSGVLGQGMMAGQQAAGNRFGAIMGGLDLAAKAVGAAMGAPVAGGGSVGGNLFNKWFG